MSQSPPAWSIKLHKSLREPYMRIGHNEIVNAFYVHNFQQVELPFRQEGEYAVLNLYFMYKNVGVGEVIISLEFLDPHGEQLMHSMDCLIVRTREELLEDEPEEELPVSEEMPWNPIEEILVYEE